MANERPRLEPKGTAAPGGRCSGIAVSADGTRLFVFHDDAARVTALEAARLNVLGHDLLGPGAPAPRFLLGRRGDLFYCGAPGIGIGVFDGSRLRFSRGVACAGTPLDVAFLPDGDRAFLVLADGDRGLVERRAGPSLRRVGRLQLEGRPLPGTLQLCSRLGMGAVLVRRPGGEREVVRWDLDSLEALPSLPVDGGAASLAFSSKEDLLFVSRPERHEVLGFGVPDGAVSRRIMMLGGAVQLAPQPEDAGVWALSEGVAHLVRVDLLLGVGPAPVRLEGLDAGRNRLRFSPEGRLAALPLAGSGHLLLMDAHPDSRDMSSTADLLETGRPLADVAWSPLGDEVYAAGLDGTVSSFGVDRGCWQIRDSGEYLALPAAPPLPPRAASKYPLFPP